MNPEESQKHYRKRIHLTIDPEAYAYLKTNGYNASRFFERAVWNLKELQTKEKTYQHE